MCPWRITSPVGLTVTFCYKKKGRGCLINYITSKYNKYGLLTNGQYIIYNLLTSAISVVSQVELDFINHPITSPGASATLLKQCIQQGFIVDSAELEVEKVLALRYTNNYDTSRAGFQILPTTGCNARCFYCYEQGFTEDVMTTETADAVAAFILDYCNNVSTVNITWFGGEPLTQLRLMTHISTQIIPKLKEAGKTVDVNIISNGALITAEVVKDFKSLYCINSVQITLDGNDEEYLKRKKYYDSSVRYSDILDKIALLAENEISVLVRLNVDRNNVDSCLQVIKDLARLTGSKKYIWPYAAPLYSDKGYDGCLTGDELGIVFKQIYFELIDSGFLDSLDGLPMNYSNATCCATMINNYVISPKGVISKCEHLLDSEEEVLGDVRTGIVFNEAFKKWNSPSLPTACIECKELPICQAGCYAAEKRGFGYGRCSYVSFLHEAIISAADYLIQKEVKK